MLMSGLMVLRNKEVRNDSALTSLTGATVFGRTAQMDGLKASARHKSDSKQRYDQTGYVTANCIRYKPA
jgi:hypothetical protein